MHWRREVMGEAAFAAAAASKQGAREERWTTAINLKHCQVRVCVCVLAISVVCANCLAVSTHYLDSPSRADSS